MTDNNHPKPNGLPLEFQDLPESPGMGLPESPVQSPKVKPKSLGERHIKVVHDLSMFTANASISPALKSSLTETLDLLSYYNRLTNSPLMPASEGNNRQQNLKLKRLVNGIRRIQANSNQQTWQLLEDTVGLIVSLQLERTRLINKAAKKKAKRTTWTNGPDDSKPTPHPTIDDVEQRGRLHTESLADGDGQPVPLMTRSERSFFTNVMPMEPSDPTSHGVDIKIGSQHTHWYKRLKETQRDNIAKLRAEGAPDEMIRRAMPRWMVAEEKAAELNEEYFNAYPHLRPTETPPPYTDEQIDNDLAATATELRREAIVQAAAGNIQGAQLMMLHAIFAQEDEFELNMTERRRIHAPFQKPTTEQD